MILFTIGYEKARPETVHCIPFEPRRRSGGGYSANCQLAVKRVSRKQP